MSSSNSNGLLNSAKDLFGISRTAGRTASNSKPSPGPKSAIEKLNANDIPDIPKQTINVRKSDSDLPSQTRTTRNNTPPSTATRPPLQNPTYQSAPITNGVTTNSNNSLLRLNPPITTTDLAALPSARITLQPHTTKEALFTFKPFAFDLFLDGPSVQICRNERPGPLAGCFKDGRAEFLSRVVTRGSHAQIWYQSHKVFIQDTGSSAGTWVNGIRLSPDGPSGITPPRELEDGDIIRLGRDFEGGMSQIHKGVVMRISIQYPLMDVAFNCRARCKCLWRAVLHRKRIYSLDQPVTQAHHVFLAFNEWMKQRNLSEQWVTWTEDDGEIVLFVLERLVANLKSRPEEQKLCLSWTRKVARHTGALPTSFILRGVERTGTDPFAGGGFADIYIGSYLGEPVALKVLRVYTSTVAQKKAQKEIAQEALFWKHLDHPHILPFLGVSHDIFPSRLTFISPWMPNGNVMGYLERYPQADKLSLLSQCAHGLCYLHHSDPFLIHGDVKGLNILIDGEGNARLADFGLTSISESQAFNTTATNSSDKGSVRFMAPELFQGRSAKSRSSDVYAFGVTMIEIYTGHPPYTAAYTDVQVMMDVLNKDIRPDRPPPQTGFTDELWNLACLCWDKKISRRPTMRDVAENLDYQLSVRVQDGLEVPTIEVMGPGSSEPYADAGNGITLSRLSLETQTSSIDSRSSDGHAG